MRFFGPNLLVVSFGLIGSATLASAVGPCPSVALSSFGGSSNAAYLNAGAGCNAIVTITASGASVQIVNPNGFDGTEDTLVGIVNSTAAPISTLNLSGSGISGFEGDGICAYGAGGAAGVAFTSGSSAYCSPSALAGTDPQDYYGPNMTYSNFAGGSAVTVNFNPPLAAGASTFLSLEAPPSTTLVVTTGPGTPTTPAPSSLYLTGLGLLALSGMYLYRRLVKA